MMAAAHLMRTDERFDVVTLDPPPPVEAAGSSLLYSVQFYNIVKKRLAPGGILAQWLPLRSHVNHPISHIGAKGIVPICARVQG